MYNLRKGSEMMTINQLQRGIVIDCARRYCSLSSLKAVIDEIPHHSGNFLQLHFSDNEGYGIASQVIGLTEDGPNVSYLTRHELREFIDYATDRMIQVIPDFDVPAHSKYWIERYQQCYPEETIQTDFDETVVDYFGSESAGQAVQQMIDEIASFFRQPQFKQRMVIGADEVPGSRTNQAAYISFINRTADYVQRQGFRPAIWNDGVTNEGIDMLDDSIDILYWQQPEDGIEVEAFTERGRAVYNYNFYTATFLPRYGYDDDAIKEQTAYMTTHHQLDVFCYHNNPYTKVITTEIIGDAMTFWNEEAASLTDEAWLKQVLPLVRAFFSE